MLRQAWKGPERTARVVLLGGYLAVLALLAVSVVVVSQATEINSACKLLGGAMGMPIFGAGGILLTTASAVSLVASGILSDIGTRDVLVIVGFAVTMCAMPLGFAFAVRSSFLNG